MERASKTEDLEKSPQARSIQMRETLIETALNVIHDLGYRSATTIEFSRRAGVSRGALLHHFPTRSDIIIAAMEKLLREATLEIRQVADEVARGKVSLEEFVDFLWMMFSGRFFYI
ncbi:MAG: TetR/AcrR family transcriptional regulator, partial [Loktanella sp.]|nr:TetR/AcrR family transcriptional regulator [Loktanella sp.]